jgi:hypothetical protein
MVWISDSDNEVNVGDFYKNYSNNGSDGVTCNIPDFILKIHKFAMGQKITSLGRVE